MENRKFVRGATCARQASVHRAGLGRTWSPRAWVEFNAHAHVGAFLGVQTIQTAHDAAMYSRQEYIVAREGLKASNVLPNKAKSRAAMESRNGVLPRSMDQQSSRLRAHVTRCRERRRCFEGELSWRVLVSVHRAGENTVSRGTRGQTTHISGAKRVVSIVHRRHRCHGSEVIEAPRSREVRGLRLGCLPLAPSRESGRWQS